jgi:hypothetical protein
MAQYQFSPKYQLDDILFVKDLGNTQFKVTAVTFDILKSSLLYTLNSTASFPGELEVKVGEEYLKKSPTESRKAIGRAVPTEHPPKRREKTGPEPADSGAVRAREGQSSGFEKSPGMDKSKPKANRQAPIRRMGLAENLESAASKCGLNVIVEEEVPEDDSDDSAPESDSEAERNIKISMLQKQTEMMSKQMGELPRRKCDYPATNTIVSSSEQHASSPGKYPATGFVTLKRKDSARFKALLRTVPNKDLLDIESTHYKPWRFI